MRSKRIHLAIKYSDTLTSIDDTVKEHRDLLREVGCVWFGKLGAPLGKTNIDKLNEQIASGNVTYVFLVQKRGDDYRVSRGTVKEVSSNLPNGEEANVPNYYKKQGILNQVTLWVKLSRLVNVGEKGLSKYHIASSGKKARKSIMKSISSLFLLADGAGSEYL